MKNVTILIMFVMLLQSCVTGYQRKAFTGGYSETQLDENVFRVSFSGNGYTRRERVSDFALLRSAELTLENGFKYFVIIDSGSFTSKSAFTTPTRSTTTGSINTFGNNSTFNASSRTTGGQTFLISKPSESNTIVLFKEKPKDVFSYNAEFIFKNMKQKYNIRARRE